MIEDQIETYLDEHQPGTLEEVYQAFPQVGQDLVDHCFRQWDETIFNVLDEARQAEKSKKENIYLKARQYMSANPAISFEELAENFGQHLDDSEMMKIHKAARSKAMKGSKKDRVLAYMKDNPDSSVDDLVAAFPDFNRETLRGYRNLFHKQAPSLPKKEDPSDDLPEDLDEDLFGDEEEIDDILFNRAGMSENEQIEMLMEDDEQEEEPEPTQKKKKPAAKKQPAKKKASKTAPKKPKTRPESKTDEETTETTDDNTEAIEDLELDLMELITQVMITKQQINRLKPENNKIEIEINIKMN